MTKLVRTRVEVEGKYYDRFAIVEEQESKLGPLTEARLVGKGEPRVDGLERVTGRAVYTFDVQLPGMLYARVLRSPHPHARIKHVDVSRAAALPGVRAVISHDNVPATPWIDNRQLFDPVVRFAGDEVAAVAADNEYVAEDALELIAVEYETLSFVVDGEEALRPGAPQVHPAGNLVGGKPKTYERGDVQRGFAEADVVVEGTFRTQAALHNCLESHGAVAVWEGEQLCLWESTQHVYGVREQVAQFFDLPLDRVRVICRYMGGGFGSKQYSGKWSAIAALLARQADRPVHLMLTRREENLATGYRQPTVQRLKIGSKRDGTLTAIDLVATAPIGAYGESAKAIGLHAHVMYACPNVRTEVRGVFINMGPERSFRGPGATEGAFPFESLMDELADRLGIDPIEIRMRNYAKQEPSTGQSYSAKHLDLCYRKGAELIGWEAGRQVSQTAGSKRRALGMACQTWGGGGGPPAFAWVKLNQDGTAEVQLGSQDIGTGTRTVFAQIAAEELGIGLDQVVVNMGDSSSGPYAPVSWGSMTVSSVGPAVRQAAADARNQLLQVIAGFLEVPAGQVEVRDGAVHVRGEAQPRARLADILGELGPFTILGKGARGPNEPGVVVRTFGAQFADVEVDTLTGEVTVLRIVTVHDIGRIVNPLGAGSQAEGATIQGIGYALTEERVVDQRTGIVLNPNLGDYLVPASLDVPEIGHSFVGGPDERANNLGAKGIGEPSLIPTAPAIANAIARATGVRFREIPITRRRILDAIHGREGERHAKGHPPSS